MNFQGFRKNKGVADSASSWRQKQKKPYPIGHQEPTAALKNAPYPIFDMTGEMPWCEKTEADPTFNPPEQLVLLVQIVSTPVFPNTATVQYVYDVSPCKSLPLYGAEILMSDQKELGAQSWHKALSFVYAGSGQFMKEGRLRPFQGHTCDAWTLNLPPQDILWTQKYEFIPEGLIVQKQHPLDLDTALYTPPGLNNAVVLYPYGGRYHPYGTLEDSVQMYWQPTFIGSDTRIALWGSSFLKQQGLKPPHEGVWQNKPVVFLNTTSQAPVRSVNAEVLHGKISIVLGLSPHDPASKTYRSTHYRFMDRATHLIELTFVPA